MEQLGIALCSDWYPPRVGGIEFHLRDLARALHARGHRVHVLTSTRGESPHDGFPVHRFDVAMMGQIAAPNLLRVLDIAACLRREQIDVVHAHGMFSVGAIGAILAARYLGLPSLTTHHSLLPTRRAMALARALFLLFSNRATIVTAVSGAAAEHARRASGRGEVPILPNGIDDGFWNGHGRLPQRERLVTSVMRLVPFKSPLEFVRAVPSVLKQVASPEGVRFAVVGDGRLRARMEREAARLGVARQMEFSGERSREDVRDLLARSSVFALPSCREAFGLAILEAQAAGVPVVAMDGGAVGEIVEHGRTGLLARSPGEFASGIATLLDNEERRERLRKSARAGLARFSWPRVAERHIELYRRAITLERSKGARRADR